MRRKSDRIVRFCVVCGDKAKGMNFNALTCQSCKAFFRRNALSNKELKCSFENHCTIDKVTRKFCSSCRLRKCFANGMKKEYILTDEEKRLIREKILQNRNRREREQQQQRQQQHYFNEKIDTGHHLEHRHHLDRNHMIDALSLPTVTTAPTNVMIDHHSNSNNSSIINDHSFLKLYFNSNHDDDDSNRIKSNQFYHNTSTSTSSTWNQFQAINAMNNLDFDRYSPNQNDSSISFGKNTDGITNHIRPNNNSLLQEDIHISDDDDGKDNFGYPNLKIPNDNTLECDDYLRYYLLKSNDLEDEMAIDLIQEFRAKFDLNMFYDEHHPTISEIDRIRLNELCSASIWLHNPYKRVLIIRNQHYFSDSPHECTLIDSFLYRIIRFTKRLTLFKSLHIDDQLQLLTYGMIEIISLFSTLGYDPEFQGWSFMDDDHKMTIKVNMDCITPCCIKYDYKTSVKNFYDLFKYEWKTDLIIFYLLTAIVLFTERPDIKDSIKIRERKTIYTQLLKNYLNLKYIDNADANWAFDRMLLAVKAMQIVETDLILHLVASTAGKKFSPLLGQLMTRHLSQRKWHEEDDEKSDCNINRFSNHRRINNKFDNFNNLPTTAATTTTKTCQNKMDNTTNNTNQNFYFL